MISNVNQLVIQILSMNYEQACKENIKIANEELSLWNALEPLPPYIKLERVYTQSKHINDNEHTEIDPNTNYLICDSGKWYLSKFYRTFNNNGWEYSKGSHKVGLSSVSCMYRLIDDLPEVPKVLINRVSYNIDEDI